MVKKFCSYKSDVDFGVSKTKEFIDGDSLLVGEGAAYADDLELLSDEVFKEVVELQVDSIEEENTQEQILERRQELLQILERRQELLQISQRRQELLQKRKRFVQTVLDAIYDKYQTKIDNLIDNNQKWHKRIDEFDKDKAVIATWWIQNRIDSIKPEEKVSTDRRNELYKRWGTARFIKQIV